MLSDKVISVEEAERLLVALAEGERRREATASRARPLHLGGLDEIGAVLGNVGQIVEDALQDTFEGLGSEGLLGPDVRDVTLSDGAFPIPAGTRLNLRNRRGGAASLELVPADGDRCRIGPDAPKGLRVRQGEGRTLVAWDSGPLRVEVPSTVTALKARLMGGNLSARALACPSRLKTMGGDLDLTLSRPFDAKTLGGTIKLALDPTFSGEGRAITMGGDVKVELAPESAFILSAVTMGGDIDADPELGDIADRLAGGGHRATISSRGGRGSAPAKLEVKTMGGNIVIARRRA